MCEEDCEQGNPPEHFLDSCFGRYTHSQMAAFTSRSQPPSLPPDDDPDLTAGHECWAVEWAEDGGWETVAAADDVTWPRIPVSVECDEGVIIAPIAPQPTLDGEVL